MIDELDVRLTTATDQYVTMFDLAEKWPRWEMTLGAFDPDAVSIERNAHGMMAPSLASAH